MALILRVLFLAATALLALSLVCRRSASAVASRRRRAGRRHAAPRPAIAATTTKLRASAVTTGDDGKEGDHTETAATATSFAGRAALVMPFVAATAALARAGFPLVRRGVARARIGAPLPEARRRALCGKNGETARLGVCVGLLERRRRLLTPSTCCSNSRSRRIMPWRSTCPFS